MKLQLPTIAKEGHIFVLIFLILMVIGFVISNVLGLILLGLTVWCALFFRDPVRHTPQIPNAVIAPADGVVQAITVCAPPEEIKTNDKEMLKISIFMNVFNVHINRTPINGIIRNIVYCAGKFFNASLDKASIHNERQLFAIESPSGTKLIMVQIAGLIARRIVKFVEENTEVKAGEKIGLIRFGSRVDLYLPKATVPTVAIGQTTLGGETILAYLDSHQPKPLKTQVLDRASGVANVTNHQELL